MIVNIIGQTAVISQERTTLESFLKGVADSFKEYKAQHVVLQLLTDRAIDTASLEFIVSLSQQHKARKLSFVLVTDMLGYEEAPEELSVVPTLQEAKDVIEMEDIERDLGF